MLRQPLSPEDRKLAGRWLIGVLAFYFCLALGGLILEVEIRGGFHAQEQARGEASAQSNLMTMNAMKSPRE
jgi:hypothetical protein